MGGIKLDTTTAPKRIKAKKTAGASIIIVITMVLSSLFLVLGIRDYMLMHNMQLTWDVIFNIASDTNDMPDMKMDDGNGNTFVVSHDSTNDDPLFRFINFEGLLEINSDVSGYIYIPNTGIDYPILKESRVGTYFYENHNIYKDYDIYGSIFELCDEQRGQNSPVRWMFGHHMMSGDMFADLLKFEEQSFVETPVYVYNESYRTQYQVAAVCIVNKNDMIFNFGSFDRDNTESYQVLLDHIAANNKVTTNCELSVDDELLMLSTCKGGAGTSTRCVVICKPLYRYNSTNLTTSDSEDV